MSSKQTQAKVIAQPGIPPSMASGKAPANPYVEEPTPMWKKIAFILIIAAVFVAYVKFMGPAASGYGSTFSLP